jgi:hypothetical protein
VLEVRADVLVNDAVIVDSGVDDSVLEEVEVGEGEIVLDINGVDPIVCEDVIDTAVEIVEVEEMEDVCETVFDCVDVAETEAPGHGPFNSGLQGANAMER